MFARERVGVPEEEIIEGLESSNAYSTLSLDAPDSSEDSALSMIDVIGGDDEALEHVENRETIKPLLEGLDPREKHILTLRFFKGMTQSEIANQLGISQMHVSRLLNRTLIRLREAWQLKNKLRALHREKPFDVAQYANINGLGIFRLPGLPSVVRLSSARRAWYAAYDMDPEVYRDMIGLENDALRAVDAVFGPSRVKDWDAVWFTVKAAALTDETSRRDFRAQLSFS